MVFFTVKITGSRFISHLASVRTDVAFNRSWSWSNIVQYNNTDERVVLNSRLRYMPEAGKEVLLVLNHGSLLDEYDRFQSEFQEIVLKLSYTFRF